MNVDYCFTGGEILCRYPEDVAAESPPTAIWTFHHPVDRDAAADTLRKQGDRVRKHTRYVHVEGCTITLYLLTIRPRPAHKVV